MRRLGVVKTGGEGTRCLGGEAMLLVAVRVSWGGETFFFTFVCVGREGEREVVLLCWLRYGGSEKSLS